MGRNVTKAEASVGSEATNLEHTRRWSDQVWNQMNGAVIDELLSRRNVVDLGPVFRQHQPSPFVRI
jgi:hypothetical protein